MENRKEITQKSFTKTDLLLVIILLIAGGGLWIWKNQSTSGTVVNIYSKNERIADLPLNRNDTYIVANELGTNTIIIENGQAYMIDADCPDKICEEMGRISKPGETIVCLPHQLVVEISDEY